jgi:hypothetical protein
LGALVLGISVSVADESAAPNFGTNATATFAGTMGWVFDHQGPHYHIFVTKLGVYDAGGDGLASPHVVGLWTANGNLLVSATIPAGRVAPLEIGYRYMPIEPLALMPAQYVIGAQFSEGDEDQLRFGPAWGLGPELYIPLQDYKPGRYSVSPEISFPSLHSGAPACEGCGMVVPWVASFQYTFEPPETRPRLTASQAGPAKVELRWSTNSAEFALETMPHLGSNTWTTVAGQPVVMGEDFSMTIGVEDGQGFFRLRKVESTK